MRPFDPELADVMKQAGYDIETTPPAVILETLLQCVKEGNAAEATLIQLLQEHQELQEHYKQMLELLRQTEDLILHNERAFTTYIETTQAMRASQERRIANDFEIIQKLCDENGELRLRLEAPDFEKATRPWHERAD